MPPDRAAHKGDEMHTGTEPPQLPQAQGGTMSDSLDAAMDALLAAGKSIGELKRIGPVSEDYIAAIARREVDARAAVRKAAREMGEEYTVHDDARNPPRVWLRKHYRAGDRVRVVKVEP